MPIAMWILENPIITIIITIIKRIISRRNLWCVA